MSVGRKTTLSFEQYTMGQSATKAPSKTWSGKRDIEGVLTTLSMNERLAWGKESVFATHRFRIAFPVGINITEKDRFIKGTQIYNILAVNDPDGQEKQLIIELGKIK